MIKVDEENPIKIYLAILNRGWLRREISADVLPLMKRTKGVQILWENPNRTWDNPISSNRNKITKRFLETDCDFLIMIDHDIVPLSNPAELVFGDYDIVGMPAKVRQKDRAINWVAYVKAPIGVNYAPVDFSRLDTDIEFYEVDAIGTGCIIIKREVLENLKAPFHTPFDEDGVLTMGTDFAFCVKAKEAGYRVWVTPWRTCEHFKEVGLSDIMSWDDSDWRDELPIGFDSLPFDPSWGIHQGDWRFIKGVIEANGIRTLLEFGSGLSTFLLDDVDQLESIVSCETDEEHARKVESAVSDKVKFVIWDGESLALNSKFDLALVDGPASEGAGGVGRRDSMILASQLADKIIVHDAGRKEEAFWQYKYLKPDFRLIKKSGHHEIRCQYWERRTPEEGQANDAK